VPGEYEVAMFTATKPLLDDAGAYSYLAEILRTRREVDFRVAVDQITLAALQNFVAPAKLDAVPRDAVNTTAR
jgi:hypothetical protein